MKTSFKALAASLFLMSSAFAAPVAIGENFCAPIVGSKRYIQNDFQAAYPKRVQFDCVYECNNKGVIEKVIASSDVRIANIEDDATLVVCQGIEVKKVSWGYDFDKVTPFYAYATGMPELKRWAFEHINRKNATEVKMLTDLKETLKQASQAYVNTKIPSFIEAAKIMDKIGAELPASTKLLDKQINELVKVRGKVTLSLETKDLVMSQIKAQAAWRIPSHEF